MIRVLVVDDSAVARELISYILSADPEVTVIGTAANGVEAIDLVKKDRPDVVTMDILMPKMDGYVATRKIMEANPVPIVVVTSSLIREEVEKTWRAVEAGAVAVLQKPSFRDRGPHAEASKKLLQTVKAMAQVKVVRRWSHHVKAPTAPREISVVHARPASPPPRQKARIVAIGSSTGGPSVLQTILSGLGSNFAAPILVVQHIAPGFTVGFVDWLNRTSRLPVRLATHGETAHPGSVYVAPDGLQMKVSADFRLALKDDAQENGTRPSVSYLFRSVAQSFGDKALGVLLTGMGRDGADELKLMRDAGAVTIAQDKDTSVVYGMPGEAAKIGAAMYSIPPQKIVEMLQRLVR
ncbi:MAG: chemotaxis response regulator protein-glutamate methylesterase [Thermodesulfobacteriota bacterium]